MNNTNVKPKRKTTRRTRKPRTAKRISSYLLPGTLQVAPKPERITSMEERKSLQRNLDIPFAGVDQAYARQCLFPDTDDEPLDVPDDKCVICSTYRDVTTLDILPDTDGNWMCVVRPSLVGFAAITAGSTYTDAVSRYYAYMYLPNPQSGITKFATPGPVLNSSGDHIMYPITGPLGNYINLPISSGNTVGVTLAAYDNIPYRYNGTFQIVDALTGSGVSAITGYDISTSGTYSINITTTAPNGIALSFQPATTVQSPMSIYLNLQTSSVMPNTYNHCIIQRNKSFANTVNSFRVPSQSLWVQYQGSDLNNQGNTANARVPHNFTPNVEDPNSWYSSIASLPYYAFETRAPYGAYNWALGDDIAYYEFRSPYDLALDQPFLCAAGSMSTAAGNKMRARIVTIYSVISRDTSRTYKPSPVSIRFPLVRGWLAQQVAAMDNTNHKETVRKALGRLKKILTSPEFNVLARAAITAASTAASAI